MVNYKSIVKKLQKHYPDAQEVAILSNNGKILFSEAHNLLNSMESDIQYCKWNLKGLLEPIDIIRGI